MNRSHRVFVAQHFAEMKAAVRAVPDMPIAAPETALERALPVQATVEPPILGFVRCQRQNVVWSNHDLLFSGGKLRCRNCGHDV
jgi:hypothetical protein